MPWNKWGIFHRAGFHAICTRLRCQAMCLAGSIPTYVLVYSSLTFMLMSRTTYPKSGLVWKH